MHMTASLTKWYKEHGRHEIFAGGKAVPLGQDETDRTLLIRDDLVTIEEQHDLDDLGIAKNAREEKTRARDAALKAAENAKMERLYREHVLGEKAPEGGFIPLGALTPKPLAPPPSAKKEEEEAVLGD
jgi:7,8-dihydro-6-hydroxymethylpterin dimethyltransferase